MSDATNWRHPDGDDAPTYTGIRGVFRAETDANGEFQTDADPDVLRDHGYVRVDGSDDLDDMTHEELKAEAESREIADDIDLRSKASIREGIENHG